MMKKFQDSGDKEEEFTLTCLLRDEFQLREVGQIFSFDILERKLRIAIGVHLDHYNMEPPQWTGLILHRFHELASFSLSINKPHKS